VVVLFVLGRKILGVFPATVAAVAFAFFTIDRWILGVFAHATHFVLLPALAGVVVLLEALDTNKRVRLVMAGVLFGAAVLMKQQAIFFLMFGAGLVAADAMKAGGCNPSRAAVNCVWLGIGAAVP